MLVHYSYKLAMAIDNIHNYRTLDDKNCEMQMRDVLDGLYDLACMTRGSAWPLRQKLSCPSGRTARPRITSFNSVSESHPG